MLITSMRRSSQLPIGNNALFTRISKQLPYPHSLSCTSEYQKKNWTTVVSNSRYLLVTAFTATQMSQAFKNKRTTTKTLNNQSSSPLLAQSFSHNLLPLFLFTDTMVRLKVERSIELTVLCQSLKQAVQASLQAICCAVSGCYLQLFQGIT